MSNKTDHTTSMRSKYAKMNLQDFNNERSAANAAFLSPKLARAFQLLRQPRTKGMTHKELAEEFGLTSEDAVYVLIKRWGKK
jgi:hypothetical protein